VKKYFFELPVYRLSEAQYIEEENKFLSDYYFETHTNKGIPKTTTTYEKFKENSNRYRDIWRYNEIIGYVRLYILGNQIRGEYYQHKTTRIRKTRTKHFQFITQKLASEKSLSNNTNADIYNIILEYVQDCKFELKKRYIDINNFQQIGKYIDWNRLIKDK
jgi:hypothetical protein